MLFVFLSGNARFASTDRPSTPERPAMKSRLASGLLFSLLILPLAAARAQAAPLHLPVTAIADDTFFVATIDLTKVDPATLEATAKAALGDKAGELDDLLAQYKTHHEKYAGKGAEVATVVFRGDPDNGPGPEPIFYVRFKPGADHAAVEKQIREDEGENNPEALEITHDGDFMLLRKKGVTPPEEGSSDRAKLFAEAMGDSEKPAVALLIFNEAMTKSIQKDIGQGAPAGLGDLAKDSKSIRLELTLGQAVAADVTIQSGDEEAAKRVADAVGGLGDLIRAQVAQMKQAFAQVPPQAAAQMAPLREMADAMMSLADAFKPQQTGTKVTMKADAKAAGAMLMVVTRGMKMEAANAPAGKGGL
jgi:hypothetical protein